MRFEVVLLFEIIILFFKAFPAEESSRGWVLALLGACGACKNVGIKKVENNRAKKLAVQEEFIYNRSFSAVAVRYLSSNFLIDFLSVVPFLVGKLVSKENDYILLLR